MVTLLTTINNKLELMFTAEFTRMRCFTREIRIQHSREEEGNRIDMSSSANGFKIKLTYSSNIKTVVRVDISCPQTNVVHRWYCAGLGEDRVNFLHST